MANFGFGMSPEWQKERFIQLDLGAGALLDVGCYPVQLATLVFGERPERICASGQLSEDGGYPGVGSSFRRNEVEKLSALLTLCEGITDPLWGESTGHQWISFTKRQ